MPHLRYSRRQVQAGGLGGNFGSMGLGVGDRLRQLVGQIKVTGYKEHWIELTREIVNELQQRRVQCIDKFVRRLERCTKGKDPRAYWDILMEGRFAVVLARNGFSKVYIEYADKGMDIKANWNRNEIYFDVTRKRSIDDEWAKNFEDLKLPSNKAGNILGKIDSKLRQLKSGRINIIVFWSSTLAVDKSKIEEAFKYIENSPEKYKDLSGVLFTESGGVNMATLKQFYLFENKGASKPLGPRLFNKLNNLHERNINQLQREREKLAVAFRKLKAPESL